MSAKRVSPRLEINGAYLLGVIGSINEHSVKEIRTRYGLDNIEPDRWYPAQKVVDFYYEIEHKTGGMFDLVAIGINVVKNIEYPPGVETMQQALGIANEMHRGGWRGADPGDMDIEIIADHHVRFTFVDLPLPVDLIYGICYGMVKRFAGQSKEITVRRKVNGNQYIFDLQW